jgi:hypothetical protein
MKSIFSSFFLFCEAFTLKNEFSKGLGGRGVVLFGHKLLREIIYTSICVRTNVTSGDLNECGGWVGG